VGQGLAWREWQPFQVKLPVAPMPGAVRTEAPASRREEKHQEKIVPLMFACGYLLGKRQTVDDSFLPSPGGQGYRI
jgi:hypothetical protein